ncbi:pyrroline-5-carboxylate reductase [Thermosporothrix hazakensis]|nr:pyrroline-5-carboxylate reductase [Thermosporothrix hazakensis]
MSTRERLMLLGAGSMAEALIKGLLDARLLAPEQITISNRSHPERLAALQERYGVTICREKEASIREATLVVLTVKPFDVVAALQEIASFLTPAQLLISVAAGVSTEAIEQLVRKPVPIIRAMPNTSSFVRESATALCRGRQATAEHVEIAQRLFSAIGSSVVVDEALMDAVTGLSGTGPAYFYYVVEALMEAGEACGLAPDICRSLLLQTLAGSAKMLQETGEDPATLRRQVTSPNGTTMAGIAVLEQGGLKPLFVRAVQRATQRALEMGQEIHIPSSTGNISSSSLPASKRH